MSMLEAYVALQTTLLHMTSHNEIETPIFFTFAFVVSKGNLYMCVGGGGGGGGPVR